MREMRRRLSSMIALGLTVGAFLYISALGPDPGAGDLPSDSKPIRVTPVNQAGTKAPESEWLGTMSRAEFPATVVVRSEGAWKAFWRRCHPGDPPQVDFRKNFILGAYAGRQTTGGYSIHVVAIEETPTELVVRFEVTVPGPNDMVTQVLTSPYHLKVVPRSNKKIRFEGKVLEPAGLSPSERRRFTESAASYLRSFWKLDLGGEAAI